jgi:hypothetical protein
MSQPPYSPDPQGGYPPPSHEQPVQTGNPPPDGAHPPGGAHPPPPGVTLPGDAGMPPFGPPPKQKSKALKITLIILAVVVVLCAGTVAVGWFAFREVFTNAADSTKITLVAPETLGGRAKSTEPSLVAAADEMSRQLKAEVPEAKGTVGAIYGDANQQDLVMIAGVAGFVPDPAKQLDQFVSEVGTELNLTGVTDVEPGPLGGTARCGNAETDGVKIGVCAWSDAGSVAMIGMYFKTAEDLKKEFVALRGEIEKKTD